MKKIITFSIVIVCVVSAIVLILQGNSKNDLSDGPGNVKSVYAQVTQITDSSNCTAIITEKSTDFNIGDEITVLNIESCYERINDELIEINDLAVGDNIMIIYFERENNTITSVRAVERIN